MTLICGSDFKIAYCMASICGSEDTWEANGGGAPSPPPVKWGYPGGDPGGLWGVPWGTLDGAFSPPPAKVLGSFRGEGEGEEGRGILQNYIYKLPIDRPSGCYW